MSVRLSYAQFSDSFTLVFDVGWLPLCGLLVACCRVKMQSDWAFLSPTLLDTTALRPAALNVALAWLNVWPDTSGAAPATPVPTRASDAAAAAATPAPRTMSFFMSDGASVSRTYRGLASAESLGRDCLHGWADNRRRRRRRGGGRSANRRLGSRPNGARAGLLVSYGNGNGSDGDYGAGTDDGREQTDSLLLVRFHSDHSIRLGLVRHLGDASL